MDSKEEKENADILQSQITRAKSAIANIEITREYNRRQNTSRVDRYRRC